MTEFDMFIKCKSNFDRNTWENLYPIQVHSKRLGVFQLAIICWLKMYGKFIMCPIVGAQALCQTQMGSSLSLMKNHT